MSSQNIVLTAVSVMHECCSREFLGLKMTTAMSRFVNGKVLINLHIFAMLMRNLQLSE